MFFDEHDPPHFHAEYQGSKAISDFNGNVMKGSLSSKNSEQGCEGLDRFAAKDSGRGLGIGKGWSGIEEGCPLE